MTMHLASYLANNWGTCAVSHCRCRCSRPKCTCGGGTWLGVACPDWTPCGATNYAELKVWQAEAWE